MDYTKHKIMNLYYVFVRQKQCMLINDNIIKIVPMMFNNHLNKYFII